MQKVIRSSYVDPDFKVSGHVWTISLIRAHGDLIKNPHAIIIIDGEDIRKQSSKPSVVAQAQEFPILLEFGEQKLAWWSPENSLNIIDRMGGKTKPVIITPEDIDKLKCEPVFMQKTWSISRIDALEFLIKVQYREKLYVQFLW